MESRTKVAGHSAPPDAGDVPARSRPTAVIFDLISFATGNGIWSLVAFYMMAAGILGALMAALPGLLDWLAIPTGTRAKRVGLYHGLGNVIVLALFAFAWILRMNAPGSPPTAKRDPLARRSRTGTGHGVAGGELVGRLGVGVDDGAHTNAPYSLSREPASRHARP